MKWSGRVMAKHFYRVSRASSCIFLVVTTVNFRFLDIDAFPVLLPTL